MSYGEGRTFLRAKIWWIAYQDPHTKKEQRESSKSTKLADAKRLLRKRREEITSKQFVGKQEEQVRFSDLARLIKEDYGLNKRRSMRNLLYRIENLRSFFGDCRAVNVSTALIRRYQKFRVDEDGVTGATVNRETGVLHRMFVLGVKLGMLSAVPVFPDKLGENPPRQGFFEHSEYVAVREHLRPDLQDVFDFAYHTGWRSAEVMTLTWKEVDLGGGVIRLSPERDKTEQGRVLPMFSSVHEVLARRQKKRRLDVTLVFHENGKHLKYNWRYRWNRACEKAGLSGKHLHDCRRTAVRNLTRAQVPEMIAMKLTGHKTRSVFDRYNITNEADLRLAGEKLADYVAQQATEPTVVPLAKAAEGGGK